MVIEAFASKKVFLDTAPLIYFIESNNEYKNILFKLFDYNDKGNFLFLTSSITLLEVLVKPLRERTISLAQQYTSILTTASNLILLDVTAFIAQQAAQLRAQYNLKTPDSIQLATAMEAGADYFLTNDARLKSLSVIHAIMLAELQ